MGKTIRNKSKWVNEEEKIKPKGYYYRYGSRKVSKQQLERELEEALTNGY